MLYLNFCFGECSWTLTIPWQLFMILTTFSIELSLTEIKAKWIVKLGSYRVKALKEKVFV